VLTKKEKEEINKQYYEENKSRIEELNKKEYEKFLEFLD
jgi:hypothetical protein